jgi:hypothetical protein
LALTRLVVIVPPVADIKLGVVTLLLALLDIPLPTELVAYTVNVYAVFGVNPVIAIVPD